MSIRTEKIMSLQIICFPDNSHAFKSSYRRYQLRLMDAIV